MEFKSLEEELEYAKWELAEAQAHVDRLEAKIEEKDDGH